MLNEWYYWTSREGEIKTGWEVLKGSQTMAGQGGDENTLQTKERIRGKYHHDMFKGDVKRPASSKSTSNFRICVARTYWVS